MKKITKMNEMAWVLGIVLCALGVALCTKADFGLSMVAAPPYLLHLKFVQIFPWYTQGTSEYFWQAVLLALMCIAVQRFTYKYLFSFVSAVLFGFTLDGWLAFLGGGGAYSTLAGRIAAFVFGELITALAIAFFFRTDMPLQIYELIVAQLAKRYGWKVDIVKRWNDIGMFVLTVLFAWLLNHSSKGVGVGTVIITLVNATCIRLFGKLLDRCFEFSPRFPKLVNALKV